MGLTKPRAAEKQKILRPIGIKILGILLHRSENVAHIFKGALIGSVIVKTEIIKGLHFHQLCDSRTFIPCHTEAKLHAFAHLAVNVTRITALVAFVSRIGIISGIAINSKKKIALVVESFDIGSHLLE